MIKAIETVWRGYRFRSRLEARWAVFFDRMGFRWEYEPEGFDIDGVRYLPDFRVTAPGGMPVWYEVKPDSVAEDAKFSAFKQQAGRAVLLSGDPCHFLSAKDVAICPRCGMIDVPSYGSSLSHDGTEYDVGCEPCDFETPSGGYHPWEQGFLRFHPHKGTNITSADDYSYLIARSWMAAEEARAARFEHGEVPA